MSDLPPPPPPFGGGPPPPPGGHVQPTTSNLTLTPASFWERLGAVLIDSLLIGVPFGIINQIALKSVPSEFVLCDDGAAICEQPTGAGWGILVLLFLLQLMVGIWYFVEFEGRRTQTIGKKALNIRVVDIGSGEAIGGGRAVGRYFARWLSALPCLLGYFWMLWDPDKQTWHDKMVRAQVIKA